MSTPHLKAKQRKILPCGRGKGISAETHPLPMRWAYEVKTSMTVTVVMHYFSKPI